MSRISRRAFIRASGGAATFGVLAGCTGGDGGDGDGDGGTTGTPTPTETSEPVVIGGLEPISGPFAPWAGVHQAGLQFAIDEVNADGGVLGGRDLQLEVADTQADAGQADSSFRRLVEQEGAVATTGAVSSDVGLRVAQTAGDLSVPHFLHMSGTDDVITQNTEYVFRVGLLPASKYIEAQADAFAAADYTQVGAIIADYAWGRSTETAIEEFFDVDVNIQVAPIGADDFSSFIRQFPDDLEMLIASGHPPGSVTMANQVFELDYSPEVVTGASTPPQLLAGALNDDAMAGYTHIHQSDPYSQAFIDTAEAFGEAMDEQFNTHTAYGYATGRMLAEAIEDAGEADPTAIADAVRGGEFDSVMASPLQYNEFGELDQAVVVYSKLTSEAPSYFSAGSFDFEEEFRSDPVPARVP